MDEATKFVGGVTLSAIVAVGLCYAAFAAGEREGRAQAQRRCEWMLTNLNTPQAPGDRRVFEGFNVEYLSYLLCDGR